MHEVTLPLAPAAVWPRWTAAAGLQSWLAGRAKVDLRPGGAYEVYFLGDAPRGMQGSETCRVLSFVPGRMLSFTWNAPPKYPEARAKRAWVVLTFKPEGKSQTRVRLVHTGFGKDGQWNEVRAYFDSAWGRVLDALVDAYK